MQVITTTMIALSAYVVPIPAFADLAFTAKMDISRVSSTNGSGAGASAIGPTAQRPISFSNHLSLYFHNARARIDLNNNLVALYNAARNKVYVLNTRDRTYYASSVSGSRVSISKANPMVVFQQPSNDPQATIAGVRASKRGVYGTCDLDGEKMQASWIAGSHDATGDFVNLKGEIWASQSVEMPTNNAMIVSALASLIAFGADELQQPLEAHLQELNEFPLKSTISTTRSTAQNHSDETTSVEFDVKSVSRKPLADSLFEIPSGYTQILSPGAQSPQPSNNASGSLPNYGRSNRFSGMNGTSGMSAVSTDGSATSDDDGGPGMEGPPPDGPGGGPGGPGGGGPGGPPE